jgi:site-specific recombinase XerD
MLSLGWSSVDHVRTRTWGNEENPCNPGALRTVANVRNHHLFCVTSAEVFCWDDGATWTNTTMRAGIKRQEKRAGLRVTGWHVLRHTFCSHLAMRGAPAKAIQDLAGHQSIAVTNLYMHLAPGALRTAIDLLESAPLQASCKDVRKSA